MKKYLLVLLAVLIVPFTIRAEWIPLNNNKAPGTPPKVTLISDDNTSTVIRIEISGFDLSNLYSKDKTYQLVDLLTEAITTEPGDPELPCVAKILAVPDQAGISVEILESSEAQIFKNITIAPARTSWIEGQPEPPYIENAKSYQSAEIFPKEIVQLDPPSVFRDFRIVRVSAFPVRYVAAKNEIHAVSSITVRINYGAGEVINPKTSPKRAIAPSFGELYRSFIYNYQNVLETKYNGKEEGHDLMLCIMPDIFVASFQVYADWKRQSGTDIIVTKFSDIGANATNPDIIKNHISNAYFNWEVPPTYVLIIGDDGVFPKKIVTYPDYSFPNEDFFVEVEGNDYFPEMMIGRFTNQGDYRMQVMINKYMLYEKNPSTSNSDWFKKGIVCSNNAYASQVETKRFTADVMLQDGGFISVDTMMSDGWGWNCTYDLTDVINALNNGRSWLNYRGEGWYSGWSANCYDFTVSNVTNLNNGQKFTFVTSIGCGVAGFHSSSGNCFGEEWIELGTLTSPRGGCAFIGPTSNTHTTYNNKIDKGIYVGMFQEGLDTPGQALLRGKLYMYNVFGNVYYVGYHYKIYCVLGDPSLHIWKDIPQNVNVNYVSSIPVGDDLIEFTVTFAGNGQPVENAEVCITGPEIFATGICDATGKVSIEIIPEYAQTLTITVRGGNVIPFQGTLQVIQYDVYVEPSGAPLVTDIDGNTDGLVNPNENCLITYTLKNWGIATATNVQATLSTENTNYVDIITTNPVSFGNIAPFGTATGNPFQFYVKPICPIGQTITLHLHVTSAGNAWDYYYDVKVMGCELNYGNFVVFDSGDGNLNFRLDPGEDVLVVLSINNSGHDMAPNVTGVLSSNDPYIIITDANGSFGSLGINGVSVNMEDFFKLSVNDNCPTGYLANFTLYLQTQNGNYPYQTTINFQMPVTLPIPTDYTGPDAYGYYAYSSDDSFFEQTPVYNWFEIAEIGTNINLPQVSDYTQTVNLPFTFKYYGQDYSQVRISTDGWIAFGSGTQTAPVNLTLPNSDNINNMVGIFWDDLYDSEFFLGKILYHHDAANHRFIIEWDSISRNNFVNEPDKEIFQVILLNPAYYPTPTGDGEIIMQYKNMENSESCTIGIENHNQNIGLQYVFDNNYDPTATNLSNTLAIKFTTKPPFTNIITSINDEFTGNGLPGASYILEQNYPNPFTERTWINYNIPQAGNVTITIYNLNGELVRTLLNAHQSSGKYSVEWNGLNNNGTDVEPGVYFYRLQTEHYVNTLKMFMLK